MTEPQYLHSESDNIASQREEVWRKDVQARVDRYRTRRGRRVEGAFSMRFPFPPPSETAVEDRRDIEVVAASPTPALVPEEAAPLLAAPQTEYSNLLAPVPPDENGLTTVSSEMPVLAKQQIAALVDDMAAAEQIAAEPAPFAPAAEPAARPYVPMPVAPRPAVRRKVIAFPRHLMAVPETAYQLAEPVVPDQPRILDVPEELEAVQAATFLDGLQFDARTAQQAQELGPERDELPCRPVTIGRRLSAVMIDAALVGVGAAVFGAAAFKMLPRLVMSKPLYGVAAVVPAVLWFVYQYLFLVYGGGTTGMRVARIRLRTFQGKAPKMRERRNRAMGLCLSTSSLAMGLLWAFVDVDTLCWHDRTSQTYLASM
jgi:uncharacterized RDD family membrane protein YckC